MQYIKTSLMTCFFISFTEAKWGVEVAAFLGNVPWYLPLTRKKLNIVMHDLIGISNGLFAGRNLYFLSVENKKLEDDIKKKLRFK